VTPALASLRVEIRGVVDAAATLAVAVDVRLQKAVVKTAKTPLEAPATTAAAHAPPTQASPVKTQVTAATVQHSHAVSAGHKRRARQETTNPVSHVMKCNARTHAAPVLTWASNVTTSTNANRVAMCQPAFLRLACPHVAPEADGVATVAVVIAALAPGTGVVAHDRAAAAEVTRVADFSADWVPGQLLEK
jgi:hypothetical protein